MTYMYVITAILLLLAIEQMFYQGVLIWRTFVRRRGDELREEGTQAESDRKGEDLEKAWQEGISAMMRYDAAAARKAVRRDGEEE